MSEMMPASSASAGLVSQSSQLLGISENRPPKDSESATVLFASARSETYLAAAVMPSRVRSMFAITIFASGAMPPAATELGLPAAMPATMLPWFSAKTGKLLTMRCDAAETPV